MNRNSLFGRISSRIVPGQTAERQAHYRPQLEPLEERKVLSTTLYVNDNWVELTPNGVLTNNELVRSISDPVNSGITATYGTNAFGKVLNATSAVSGNNYLTAVDDGVAFDYQYIQSAIRAAVDNNGDTVSIIEGVYTESDIVINKSVVFQGSGRSGSSDTVIVPEATSARAEQEFPDGSHSAIFIYSDSVSVRNLHINGNGNGTLGANTFSFHQGVTTYYEDQNGPGGGAHAYTSIRSAASNLQVTMSLADVTASNVYGPFVDQARREPHLDVASITVENTWYRGITFSAPTGTNFGRTGSAPENEVHNTIVSNVGDPGNQGANHVGIVIQNLDDYNTGDPGGAPAIKGGNAYDNTITNAGIGLWSNAYGTRSWNSRAAARNDTTFSFNTVVDARVAAYRMEFLSGGDFIANRATWTGVNTATGIWAIQADMSFLGNKIGTTVGDVPVGTPVVTAAGNGPQVGFRLENSKTGQGDAASTIIGISQFMGPASGTTASVGILADNNGAFGGVNSDTSFLIAQMTNISGFETGVKSVQNAASTVPNLLFMAGGNSGISGNTVGVQIGPNVANAGVQVIGQWNSPDPVVDPGSVILGQFLPNVLASYADTLTNQPVPPVSPSANVAPPAPTVATATLPKPDTIRTGNLTWPADGTFAPLLNGDVTTSSTFVLEDFVTSVSYSNISDLDHVNPWNTGFINPSRLGFWAPGQTVQNGDGTLQIGNVSSANEVGGLINLTTTPHDVSQYGYLQVIVKKGGAAMTAPEFLVSVVDLDGTSDLYYFPTLALTTSGYTTMRVNLLNPPVRFVAGDGVLNLGAIAGWAVTGDFGSTTGSTTKTLSLVVESISYVAGPRASSFDVTGTVNLTNAVLAPTNNGKLYVSSNGQQFTIVNNDGTDAVVGTFTGLAQGATVTVGSDAYTIDYSGGTGNDVVLTQVSAITSSSVTGRHIFYNQSAFDGNNASITPADDGAIAPDKTAYLPGDGLAGFQNITSYSRGINGIMVDLAPTGGGHTSITANDFVFKVGANNSPNTWVVAPAPSAVSVRTGAGVSGGDRVEITWAAGVVKNQWLMVATKANANTGLVANNTVATPGGPVSVGDIFFYGNRIGDTGSPTATSFTTTTADASTIIAGGLGAAGGITNVRDIDKSNTITVAGDRAATLGNIGALNRLTVGTAGPFAPEDGDSGIASALAATPSSNKGGTSDLPPGIVRRLSSLDLNSGRIAAYFQHLAEVDSPGSRKLLTRLDAIADELGLEHDLLDDIVAGL
ncbi:MAG: beta strand repeat-containing protein [Pirellulales bacterium]